MITHPFEGMHDTMICGNAIRLGLFVLLSLILGITYTMLRITKMPQSAFLQEYVPFESQQ